MSLYIPANIAVLLHGSLDRIRTAFVFDLYPLDIPHILGLKHQSRVSGSDGSLCAVFIILVLGSGQ